ncbi:MAG: hypothetical protein J4415_04020 [Candidatus Diapherotrites archaeon]|uniref:Uncharacterized protein n=1 Tax=Candidatus Iainarchaeum sp. TaxID=3101447 RepID=A0A8T4L1V0_9ARCH|nr:hypothetical protein [Candidatus Diapherotrites archaeon]
MIIRPQAYPTFMKAVMLLGVALIAITVFVTAMIQGVLVHLAGNVVIAIASYLIAWVALGTAALTFFKGWEIMTYVRLAA